MNEDYLAQFEALFQKFTQIAAKSNNWDVSDVIDTKWFSSPKKDSEIESKLKEFIQFLDKKIEPQLEAITEKMKNGSEGGHLTTEDLNVQKVSIILCKLKDLYEELTSPPTEPSPSGEDKDSQY